jgi:hypothetical protein
MTGEVINTPERFAKWERELAKRQLSPEDAARERTQWSSDQDVRDTRWGTPEEITNPIVFAVSDAASYINGGELVADNAMDKSWNSGQAALRASTAIAAPGEAAVRRIATADAARRKRMGVRRSFSVAPAFVATTRLRVRTWPSGGGRQSGLGVLEDHIRALLADHDRRRIGVAGHYGRHDRGVDHA